jgi:hypothetical protein
MVASFYSYIAFLIYMPPYPWVVSLVCPDTQKTLVRSRYGQVWSFSSHRLVCSQLRISISLFDADFLHINHLTGLGDV